MNDQYGNEQRGALTLQEAPQTMRQVPLAGQMIGQTRGDASTTVMQFTPRDPGTALTGVLKEAKFAQAGWYYSWTPRSKGGPGSKAVEGPSIGLALALLRHWRNVDVHLSKVEEDDQSFTLSAEATDKESGITINRLFRQSKNTAAGGSFDRDRALDIALQIGQSKATRNVLVRGVLPEWLVKRAMGAAKNAVKQEATADDGGLKRDSVDMLLADFSRHGVTLQMLESKCGHKINDWTPDDVADLAGVGQAIEDGQTTVKNEFSPQGQAPEVQDAIVMDETGRQPVQESLPEQGAQPGILKEISRLAKALGISGAVMGDMLSTAGIPNPPVTQAQAEKALSLLGKKASERREGPKDGSLIS
jgi:hypothetical protein